MGIIGISLAAVLLLLMANAFFVAAEFALVKSRSSRLELRADSGNAAAALTVRMQSRMEPYLAACQLGITMASLGLGWIGEPAVAAVLEPLLGRWSLSEELLHQIAFVLGFLIFSSLHIVIGEQVPKSLAIRQPEPVSIFSALPLQLFFLVAYPLTWLLDRASRGVLKLLGVEEGTHAELLTLAELKGVIATSEAYGNIPTDRAEMLHNLIDFDQRSVGWVMIPRNNVVTLNASGSPQATIATLRESRHSRFPLVASTDNDDLLGVVLAKDLHLAMLDGVAEPWQDLKSYCREPLVIPESQTVSRTFEILRNEREHLAIVVDEYGHLVGIVTLEDLLEEVVGEIMDETDAAEQHFTIEQQGEGRWLIDGSMSLSDAQREIGLQAEIDIQANSVSGLIVERLARMPEAGDYIDEGDLRLTVQTLENRRVARVLVERRVMVEVDDAKDV
jgi:CBS domain containing-hemolysin-like protein